MNGDRLSEKLRVELDALQVTPPATPRYQQRSGGRQRVPRLALGGALGVVAALALAAGVAAAAAPPQLVRLVHSELEWLPLPEASPTPPTPVAPSPEPVAAPAAVPTLAPARAPELEPESRSAPPAQRSAPSPDTEHRDDRPSPSPTPGRTPTPSPSPTADGEAEHS